MAEHEPQNHSQEFSSDDVVHVRPLGYNVGDDGKVEGFTQFESMHHDPEQARQIEHDLATDLGFIPITPEEAQSHHFFSSKKWNSPWNPEGPKPNWRVNPPPADPSAN